MPRRFGQVSLYRVLVGAVQSEVQAAVNRWLQKDSFNTSFRTFIFALQMTLNVSLLIPRIRRVSVLLNGFLEMMGYLLWLYEFFDPPGLIEGPQRTPDRKLVDQGVRDKLVLSLQAILDSLVSK